MHTPACAASSLPFRVPHTAGAQCCLPAPLAMTTPTPSLKSAPSPHAHVQKGCTALEAAASSNFPEVVRMLLEAGADANSATAVRGGTAALRASGVAAKAGARPHCHASTPVTSMGHNPAGQPLALLVTLEQRPDVVLTSMMTLDPTESVIAMGVTLQCPVSAVTPCVWFAPQASQPSCTYAHSAPLVASMPGIELTGSSCVQNAATPLVIAAYCGYTAVAEALLCCPRVDVNARDEVRHARRHAGTP
jgi:hypothetical protein